MKTDDFNYNLPNELIAQSPLKNRSASKLLVMDKVQGTLQDDTFCNILNYLKPGDCLVLNDTKVIPARLVGEKAETKAIIELLLLKNIENNKWECLAKPARRLHIDTVVSFGDGLLKARVYKRGEEGLVYVEFIYDGIFMEILDKLGSMPLPPYIHEKLEDKSRYQTVYAKNIGSAAAPTAGLHFTHELLREVEKKGIDLIYVTLHVGLGTFRPVEVEDVKKHHMHSEYYVLSEEAAIKLNNARKEKRNIYAVGTTSTRVLETVMHKYNSFKPCSGNTDIFIYPGFEFKAIDGLITNFHLPKSTLLMLVAALATKEHILNAYNHAIKERYRFFSFGDAMFIK